MTFARELIENGRIPPAEALLVEAMFAEHDLPLEGDPCTEVLCIRAAAGVAPDRAGAPHGWLQLGLSSNVDPDAWQPPATTYVFTIDVSGSMGWQYADGEDPAPAHLAKLLAHALAEQLRPVDEIAIVTYGSNVRTVLPVVDGDEKDRAHGAIDGLRENGSTNMEAGLRAAYQIGRDAIQRGRDNVRIVLFTDEQPNVGATSPEAFGGMVAEGAEDGVEITVLALGLGLGSELLEAMSHLRGANAFSFVANDDTDVFMNDDFPWFVSPIAYDLTAAVTPSAGLGVDATYGFPGGAATQTELDVASVFLSKRKGALLISLAPTQEGALDGLAADIDLTFTTRGGSTISRELRVERAGAPLDERGHWFAQPSVAATTALALLVDGMHDAAEQYASSPDIAQTTMQLAHDRFAADAAATSDPQLAVEVDLAAAMLQLIVERAPQGSLYDQGY
jgi:Ca-activated chloride channel family protein